MATAQHVESLVRRFNRGIKQGIRRTWRGLTAFLPIRDRYVLRNYFYAYLVCTVSFLGLYVCAEVLSRLKKFLAPHGIPFWQVLIRYYSVMIPVAYTYYLGPVLTLSAAMFALTMLNKNNEIMPLKAAGMSLYRIVTPIFCVAAFFSVLTFASQEFFIPNMRDAIREVYGYSHRSTSIASQILYDGKGTEFIVGRYWPAQKRAEDVIITEREWCPELGKEVPKKRYITDYMQWEQPRDRRGAEKSGITGRTHKIYYYEID